MAASLLAAAAVAPGRHVSGQCAGSVRGEYDGGQTYGRAGSGLIVNISFWAAQKRTGNVAYGVSEAATDRMTVYMAEELKDHGVAVVSLYPGLVRTESVMRAAAFLDLSNSESPRFIGRAVAALASDPDILARSGTVCIAASLARECGFIDIDGKLPLPLTIDDV